MGPSCLCSQPHPSAPQGTPPPSEVLRASPCWCPVCCSPQGPRCFSSHGGLCGINCGNGLLSCRRWGMGVSGSYKELATLSAPSGPRGSLPS